MRRVEVEWLDSMSLNLGGWDEIGEFEEAMTVEAMTHRSCGYLIAEDDNALIVANSLYEQHNLPENRRAAGAQLIPRAAVLSVKELNAGEKYRRARNRQAGN